MTHLYAPSEAAMQIIRALNLPTNAVAFTLRMRAGEFALVEVETYATQEGVDRLATVLKRYRLEKLEGPNVADQPARVSESGLIGGFGSDDNEERAAT